MITDYVYGTIMLFAISMSFIVAFFALGELNDSIQANPDVPAIAKSGIQNNTDRFDTVLDWTFVLIYAAVIIGSVIISYVLPTNPGLYFGLVIVIVIISAIAGYLANAYVMISEEDSLSATFTNYPMMSYIIQHYLLFTMITGFIMLIAFFARPQEVY